MDEPDSGELGALRATIVEYRRTVGRKTAGLDAEQLARRSVPPSTLSLLGLVRHLAQMEHHWFRRVLQRHPEQEQLFCPGGDWNAQFDGAVADDAVVSEAFAGWRGASGLADTWLDGIKPADLEREVPDEGPMTVRDVLLQVVREYARHCGHLDLLRERIDGETGE